ncbi:hypothetical protein APSETT444_004818 [Aspergillus pseudonomiae]
MNLRTPEVPVLFLKPPTALADPWPSPTILPKITQIDDAGDYEAELVVVIGRDAKDVSEQDALDDLIFNVPKMVSFLSQGTTLPAGTLILTGTPPGVGAARNPKESLRAGDTFGVELLPHVGTLLTKVENQK